MLVKTTDGTPDGVKVACPVWSGGKSDDNLKGLPITISRNLSLTAVPLLCTAPISKTTIKAKCQPCKISVRSF